ncbi:MAG: prepilin peptidase [bacterium]|nr:prepilin peptidase [bacterium]
MLGTIFGSFANVVILRLGTGERVLTGRSRCFSCGRELRWFELIPLASFFVQRGRCRRCFSKISWQYPLVEFLMGLLFLFVYLKWDSVWWVLAWWLWMVFLMVILAVYDLKHKILPDKYNYLFVISGAFNIFGNFSFWSLAPALFLFLLWFFSSGRWMGLGDAKFMAAAGLFLSWPGSLTALLVAFWTGALGGLALLAAGRAVSLKSEIAFGPFLALGTLVSFFFPGALNSLLFLW